MNACVRDCSYILSSFLHSFVSVFCAPATGLYYALEIVDVLKMLLTYARGFHLSQPSLLIVYSYTYSVVRFLTSRLRLLTAFSIPTLGWMNFGSFTNRGELVVKLAPKAVSINESEQAMMDRLAAEKEEEEGDEDD